MEPFELFALRYATHTGRKTSDNEIGGDPHESGADLDYFVWVARRSDRVFVIDTGFGPEQAAARGRNLIRSPSKALADMGIDARQVEDVVLTHLHYDHAGTLDDFAKARFHIQEEEVCFATGRHMCDHQHRAPFAVEDVVGLVRKAYAGRVNFHAETRELTPGLSVHRTGGHSKGLQVVRVWTRRGWVVLASDASHYFSGLSGDAPFPILFDRTELMEGLKTVHALADSSNHIIPGHDPLVCTLYPSLQTDIFRLDVDPNVI